MCSLKFSFNKICPFSIHTQEPFICFRCTFSSGYSIFDESNTTESSRTMLIKYTAIYISRTVLYTAYRMVFKNNQHCAHIVHGVFSVVMKGSKKER